MEAKLDFFRYDYYWILLDILNRKHVENTHLNGYSNFAKEYFNTPDDIGLAVVINSGKLKRSSKLAKTKYFDADVFYDRYVFIDDFLDTSLVWSIGKVKADIVKKIFINQEITSYNFSDFLYKLWWYSSDNNYFGEGNKSIFKNKIEDNFARINNPFLLYIDPKEMAKQNNLNIQFNTTDAESILEAFHSHTGMYDYYNNTLISHLSFSDRYGYSIFVNLERYSNNESQIHIPITLYETAHQLAYHYWIKNKLSLIADSKISKYPHLNLSAKMGLREISKIQSDILSNSATVNNISEDLSIYLPSIKDFQNYFSLFVEEILLSNRKFGKKYSFSLSNELYKDLSRNIDQLEKANIIIQNKVSNLISNLRDKLTIISTKTNIRLQYYMLALTIIILILTLATVLDNEKLLEIILPDKFKLIHDL